MQKQGILYCGEETKKEYPSICEVFARLPFVHEVVSTVSFNECEHSSNQYDYAILLLTQLDEEAANAYVYLEQERGICKFLLVDLCQMETDESHHFNYINEDDTMLQVNVDNFDFNTTEMLLKQHFSQALDTPYMAAMKLLEKGFIQAVLLDSTKTELEKYMIAFNFHVLSVGCLSTTVHRLTRMQRKRIRWYLAEHFSSMTFGFIRGDDCYLFMLAKERITIDKTYKIATYIHSLGINENDIGVSSIRSCLGELHNAFMESHENYLHKRGIGRDIEMYHIRQCEEELQDIIAEVGHDLYLGDMDAIRVNIDVFMRVLLGISSVNRTEIIRFFLKRLSEEMNYLQSENMNKIQQILDTESEKFQVSDELNAISVSLTYLLKLVMKLISRNKEPHQHDMLIKVYDYIWDNYHKPIGLNEVAEYLNVTPQYICMLFTKHTNTKFNKLLNYTRIKHAKKLLRDSKKVKEVASFCGYQNISYFEKKFKTTTGYTPREYQDIFKNDI